MDRIFGFGYNRFGQLQADSSNKQIIIIHPQKLNFSEVKHGERNVLQSDKEGSATTSTLHWPSTDGDCGLGGGCTAESGARKLQMNECAEGRATRTLNSDPSLRDVIASLKWNAVALGLNGGLVLGCLFGQKDSVLELSSRKDISPSRDLCLCEDRLFCINQHGDCYILELSDATGASPKKVSVYNEVRTAGRDSLHSQSHRIADKEGIAAVGQVTLGAGSSTLPAVPRSEHGLPQTSDKKTGVRHLACGDSLVLCALDPDRRAGRIVRSKEDEFVVHHFSHPLSVRAISCGKEHGLLLVDQGLVYSVGLGSRGQLGHGDTDSEREPRLIEALGCVGVTSVSAGGWHSACISDIGDLYVWGWNEAGQLGLSPEAEAEEEPGASPPRSDHSPSRVTFQMVPAILDLPGGVNVSKVSCGSRHTAAVTYDKRLYTWGWGKYGQLGHGDMESQDQPKHVEFFHNERLWVTDIMCGDWTTVAQTCPALQPMPP